MKGWGGVTLTSVLAVYGALLSTYNAFTIWLESRRTVQVGIRFGKHPDQPRVFLSAVNTGKRLVYLRDCWLALANKRWLWFQHKKIEHVQYALPTNDDLPFQLSEGKTFEQFAPARLLARQLQKSGYSGTVKLVAYFKDHVGNLHHSKRLRFQIENFLQEEPAAEPGTFTIDFTKQRD